MDKIARKSSTDPNQEKLREAKAVWNKRISAFIDDLIHYKRLMNGHPSKFNGGKSRIIDPIPADPATIIGSLANDFNEMAQIGSSIISQQLEYSKTRRQKQPRMPLAIQPPPPANDNSTLAVASRFEEKYGLRSEGSNIGSRLLTRILTPTIGWGKSAQIRRLRMTLLNLAVRMHKSFENFEYSILQSTDQSILDASKLLDVDVRQPLLQFGNKLLDYKKLKDKATPKTDKPGDQPPTGDKPPAGDQPSPSEKKGLPAATQPDGTDPFKFINVIVSDFMANASNLQDLNVHNLNVLFNKYRAYSDEDKLKLVPEIVQEYELVLAQARKLYSVEGTSFGDIFINKNINPAKTANANLVIYADKAIRKMLGKSRNYLAETFNTNPTASTRLDLADQVKECLVTVNNVMNSLERGLHIEELIKSFEELKVSHIEMTRQVNSLIPIVNENRFNAKKHDEKFERALQTKKNRDMVNLHNKYMM